MKIFSLFFLLAYVLIPVKGQDSFTVGILDEQLNSESEVLLQQLQQEISGVLGSGTQVYFQDVLYNNYDLSVAKNNYTSLVSSQVDVIISFGAINTVMLIQEKNYPKPVIIVGSINNDLVDIPKNQPTSEINNLTYLVTPFSYAADLDAFSSIFPFRNVGIVIDEFMLELLPLEELFGTYFEGNKDRYQIVPIAKEAGGIRLPENLDAIYLASYNNLSDSEVNGFIFEIASQKLPSMSGYGVKDVERGVLSTNQPAINLDQIFRRVALSVESIKEGTNASDLPIQIDYKQELTLNMAIAEQIDFPIKNSMLAGVNLIEGTPLVESEFAYSLIDVMKGVIDRNLSLEAERKNIGLSEQDVKSSKSQYLPDLNANAAGTYIDPRIAEISNGENPEFSTSGNLNLNQLLYSEEATANIAVQKELLAAQSEEFNSIELDAILEASISYFNALILKANLSIQNTNLQLTKLNLEIANQNLELGASGKSDVLRFQSQLAQNTQSMIEARSSLNQAYFQINQLLNNPIGNKIEIQDTLIENWTTNNERYNFLIHSLDEPLQRTRLIDFFVDEAIQNAPEIKGIDYNTLAAQRIYRLNDKGRYIPTLALQGQYNYLFSTSGAGSEIPAGYPVAPDGTYNFGVNLSLPIFNQNIRNINRQSSKIQIEQLTVQKENIELSIERNINDLVLELTNQIANIEISAVNLQFSKESLELSQTEYKNGAIPVVQLIDAQNNYIQAFLANATARYNYLLVSMQLQRATGYFFDMNTEASNQEFVLRARQYMLTNN